MTCIDNDERGSASLGAEAVSREGNPVSHL